MILLLKLALAIVTAHRSPAWIEERAHVVCYQVADRLMSERASDAVCGESADEAHY